MPMLPPTIYYICYLPPRTGGELVNLQHVAALHRHGVRTVALVNFDGELEAGLIDGPLPMERLAPGREFSADDIVVIPEYYREALDHFSTLPCRRVLHVQGPFLLFRGIDSVESLNGLRLSAGISCSRYGGELMRAMDVRLDWHIVTPFLLPAFKISPLPKKRQIAWMPGKRPREAPVLRALFRKKYPQYDAVPWISIVGMSRTECAAVMADSAVFASLSRLEGLGLPPLEAMASDCLVCGFDGHGGRDFARSDNGQWVAEGDHVGFIDSVAAMLTRFDAGGEECALQLAAGRATAAGYSERRFSDELQAIWKAILGEAWPRYRLAA